MTLALLLVACLLTCAGQIAQKFAVESWRGITSGVAHKLRSPWLWLALLCLGLGLLVWLLVLQRLEVGIAYPMLSLNFVLITLLPQQNHPGNHQSHTAPMAQVYGFLEQVVRHECDQYKVQAEHRVGNADFKASQ